MDETFIRRMDELLRRVRERRRLIATGHGCPDARVMGARDVLLARLRAQAVQHAGPRAREELYEGDA